MSMSPCRDLTSKHVVKLEKPEVVTKVQTSPDPQHVIIGSYYASDLLKIWSYGI